MPEGRKKTTKMLKEAKSREYQDPMLAVLVFNKQYFILVDDNHNI